MTGLVPLYDLDGASFSAGGRTILEPLSLSLAPARLYGLIGSNGSGKSTLVKMLARQQEATAGTVTFDGRSVGDYSDRTFARNVAYLPQFTPPAEGLSVRELVGLGRYPWHGALGRMSTADYAKIELALEQTDLMRFSDRLVDTLSGGERQRAWLAMMLAQDTKCLLLDEPTSALDIAHQVEMLALIRNLSAERGIGVIVVLHDVNMAARYCDEILALGAGRLIARGLPADILRQDVLADIYGLRMGIMPHPVTGAPISYVQ